MKNKNGLFGFFFLCLFREEEENNLPQMKKLFFLYVWLREKNKHNGASYLFSFTFGRIPLLISRGSGYPALSPLRYRYVTFKQHLLSLTQGTNNHEAEKRTITGFVKESLILGLNVPFFF